MIQKRKRLTALLDASSAIILYKADLHIIVCEMYKAVMSLSVYDEVTGNACPGAKAYQHLLVDKKLTLQRPAIAPSGDGDVSRLLALHKGERDLIQLYNSGYGDFVITDDGDAARYCRREQVPFINALLIPVILSYTDIKSVAYCQTAFNKVKNTGRYSHWVINLAEKCHSHEMAFFFPQNPH